MAEEANPLSPREGKLLKLVPLESRLTVENISANLAHAVASRLQADSPLFLIDLWKNGEDSVLALAMFDPLLLLGPLKSKLCAIVDRHFASPRYGQIGG